VTAGVCLGLLLTIGCSPALISRQDFNRNPVEIVEESPRVYRIMFEHFADSLETARVMNYMGGMVPYGLYVPEDRGQQELTRSDSSLIEYRKAVKRLDAGAGQAGLMHVRRAIEKDPAFLPSYVLLARILIEEGQIIRAKEILDQVLSRNPTYSEALVEVARCHMYMGQLDLAKKALIDAVIFERTNLNAWSELKRLGMVERFDVAARDAPELAFVEKARGRNLDMVVDSSLVDCPMEASAWIVFASQRAVWKFEGKSIATCRWPWPGRFSRASRTPHHLPTGPDARASTWIFWRKSPMAGIWFRMCSWTISACTARGRRGIFRRT
jgi:hypothetical protein